MCIRDRAECALIAKLQADGLPVEHRPDADPRAVLGIELMVAKVPAIMAPFGEAARAMRHVTEIIGLTPGDQS